MLNKSLFSSNSSEWETPIELFNEYNNIFNFTLDLCASESNHLCSKYFTLYDSCFDHRIVGECIWCNPPYGRSIGKFVEYCNNLSNVNRVVVMLLPARTDTKWFHDFIYGNKNVSKIIFLKGRLKFSRSKYSAPFPSMIVIFVSNCVK